MKLFRKIILLIIFALPIYAQDFDAGQFSGNFQFEGRSYTEDTLIGAPKVDEAVRSNGFLTMRYNIGKFEIGMRYENYMNPILGYDPRLKGQGIANRYLNYRDEQLEVTAGNFYEQFGSGMIFRTYEEWALGFDNSLDGIKVKLRPTAGLELTALVGSQRFFWDKSPGQVRGGDLNLGINSLIPNLMPDDLQLELGASVVSRYQKDDDNTYNLPQNVLAYSTRFALTGLSYSLNAEYAYKNNDPNARNKFQLTPGQGILINASYFTEGLGISLDLHRVDNMDFRSDIYARGNESNLNFIPPLTKQHTYALAAVYPFSTKPNGEAGLQLELTYKIDKKYNFISDYDIDFEFNYSSVYAIDSTWTSRYNYESGFFAIGDRKYFSDINFYLSTKLDKNLKCALTYLNINYDKDIMENEGAAEFGVVRTNVIVLDFTYKLNDHNSIRTELQHLWFKQDSLILTPDNVNGNWAQFLVEYTIAPDWFFTIYDQFNYGNDSKDRQIHYINANAAYMMGSTRLSFGFGRQRSGIMCVGGVCRFVPAANGFNFSITSSF